MKRLRWFVVPPIAGYALWLVALWLGQRALLFPRAGVGVPSDPPRIPGLERLWVESSFGRSEAWFLPAPIPDHSPAPVLIFGHGNGEVIDQWPAALEPFRGLGLSLLLVEYPGYGRSTGSPSERSIAAAFRAAYDIIARRADVDPKRIVVYGQSLGGGAVCTLLGHRPIAAAILQSTFPSTRIFATRYFAPSFLTRDPFENAEALRQYPGPVLVIHGRRDELIPFENGLALSKAAANGRLLSYDCGHWCWDPERLPFWSDVTTFLSDAHITTPGKA